MVQAEMSDVRRQKTPPLSGGNFSPVVTQQVSGCVSA